MPARTPAPRRPGVAAAPVGVLDGRVVRTLSDGLMRVSVWVPPDVRLTDSDPVAVSLPLPLPVDEGVGRVVIKVLTLTVSRLELEVGGGVCTGPSGVVKLSSPARKLEQTAMPALAAAPKSVGLVQLVRRQPPTLPAMIACVGPHWHAISLS
jgi:hypothetical protein